MSAIFYAFIPIFFIKNMSFSKEREKRLEYGYGEVSDIEYLDEKVKDEVVSDSEYFSNQSNNDNKIKNSWKDWNVLN